MGDNLLRLLQFQFKKGSLSNIWVNKLKETIEAYSKLASTEYDKRTTKRHFSREFKIAVVKAEREGQPNVRAQFGITAQQMSEFRRWFKTQQRRTITPLKTVNYLTFEDTLPEQQQQQQLLQETKVCTSLDHPEPETIPELVCNITSNKDGPKGLGLSPGGAVLLKKARKSAQ